MVTFKMESDIDIEKLFEIGKKRISDGYQIVVVNRLEDMEGTKHVSHIISKDKNYHANTKKELSKTLIDVLEKDFQ